MRTGQNSLLTEGDDEDAPAEEEPELEGLDWLDDLEDELVAEGAIDDPDAAELVGTMTTPPPTTPPRSAGT